MYAAPEQTNGEPVDERADLYAVGCILHEMLTGTVPRPYDARVLTSRYPNLLVVPDLDRLLASLLSDDPSQRPATALDALSRVDMTLNGYAMARRLWEGLGLGSSPY